MFGDLGSLTDNKVACAVYRQHGLLALRLYLDKSHRWTAHCFADHLRIDCVRFSTLDIWLDVIRWHQTDFAPQIVKLKGFVSLLPELLKTLRYAACR